MDCWNSLSKEDKTKRTNLQIALEQDQLEYSLSKYWKSYEENPAAGNPEQELIWQFVNECAKPFHAWLSHFNDSNTISQGKYGSSHWTQSLLILRPEQLAAIVITEIVNTMLNQEVLQQHASNGIAYSFQKTAFRVGKAIKQICEYRVTKKTFYEDWLNQSHYLKNWEPKRCKGFVKKFDGILNWTKQQQEDVGTHMLHIASKSNVIHTLSRKVRRGKKWSQEILVYLDNDIVNKLVKLHGAEMLTHIIYRPMLVPPVPHEIDISGGLLDINLRKQTTDGGSKHTQFDLEAINALSQTEWAINIPVLEIMDTMFQHNWDTCNLPPSNLDTFMFTEPYPEDGTPQDKAKWTDAKASLWGDWYKTEQKRIQMLFRLSMAKQLAKLKFFYHSYTFDFRGRAYTITPMLSPQSGDFDRGLLKLATPVSIQDDESLYWIKVQLCNLMDGSEGWNGTADDKETFDNRVAWVDDNHDMLLTVAENPLEYASYWMDNETIKKNPSFQRLAAILDYANVINKGYSELCVQLDGSCNGSQHWSAIRGDIEIATLTNVIPGDKPQDLYAYVAHLATKELIRSHKEDHNEWAAIFNDKWKTGIHRKVVKRATMCDSYGITPHGIRRYAREEGHLNWVQEEMGKEFMAGAVNELARLTLHGLEGAMVMSNQGKDYLRYLSNESSEQNKPLQWTTPTGFLVVHRYPEFIPRVSYSQLYNKEYVLQASFGQASKEIDQSQSHLGIPPNFIHALDASHMRMVVNRLKEAGVTQFCMIHDSFGCPAPYIPIMRKVIKETFYEIHQKNQLNLLQQDVERFLGKPLQAPPDRGDLDITGVLSSDYLVG